MSYLAIDLGNKRVGIAKSEMNIAFAHSIVSRAELVSFLKKYISKNPQLTHIVVGLPYDLYGKKLTQLHKTQDFIEKLKGIFPSYIIVGHDERFSSFIASDGFDDHRDDIAAQCILQSYLDTQNNSL